MLLAIDIGNTNMVVGIYDLNKDDQLIASNRVGTHKRATSDELGVLLKSLLFHSKINSSDISGIICSSVVPPINHAVQQMSEKFFHTKPLFVTHQIRTGITFNYPNPSEIGADRIVNAVAVHELYGGPAIIIDFGTATTFCVLSEKAEYMGGIIMPGLIMSMESLSQKASKLPNIELQKPDTLLGKSTSHAMCSGVYYGAVYMLEGMIEHLKQELSLNNCQVIATGGLSKLIQSGTHCIDVTDTLLTLKGLKIIYNKNK